MLRKFYWNNLLPISGNLGYRVGQAYNFLKEAQTWTREEIEAHQGIAVNQLMTHCYENVPYYFKIMKQRKLVPADFKKVEDLSKIPLLTRDDIRKNLAALRSRIHPDRRCVFARSGGSSGIPLTVALSSKARAFALAAYIRGFQWMGHQWGKPIIKLFGGSLGIKKTTIRRGLVNYLFNVRALPAFELQPNTAAKYFEAVEDAGKATLASYASTALNFANYARENNWTPSQLYSVICTAEQMPDIWKKSISEQLKAPVYCYYGCAEINSLGYQHQNEEGYVVPQEHVVMEIGQENSEAFVTEDSGNLVVTSLYNYAMPMIRYLNGDCAKIGYSKTGQMKHQRIFELQGRVMDQLVDSRGVSIGSVLPTYIIQISGVNLLKYQVVQYRIGHVEFHYEMTGQNDLALKDRNLIAEVLQRYLGNDTVVDFKRGGFELTPAGKHRLVISKVIFS